MADQLTNVATADAFTDAASLGPAGNVRQLRFIGYNQAFVVQLYKYVHQPGNTNKWSLAPDEYVYAANSGDVFGPEVAGVRFRSYTTGKPASIFCVLAYMVDPPAAPLPPFAAIASSPPSPGSSYTIVGQGHKNGTNGVATVLAGALACAGVSVRAKPSNTGLVYLGDGAVTTGNGYELSPGDAIAFDVGNVNQVFFDVDTNGEGVSWMAVG